MWYLYRIWVNVSGCFHKILPNAKRAYVTFRNFTPELQKFTQINLPYLWHFATLHHHQNLQNNKINWPCWRWSYHDDDNPKGVSCHVIAFDSKGEQAAWATGIVATTLAAARRLALLSAIQLSLMLIIQPGWKSGLPKCCTRAGAVSWPSTVRRGFW